MSSKHDGNPQQYGKVIQLGFNISVSGDPNTDFQIVLDDKGQKDRAEPLPNAIDFQPTDSEEVNVPKKEIEYRKMSQEVNFKEPTGTKSTSQSMSASSGGSTADRHPDSSTSKELTLIDDIKATMDHFEKFSGHIKEVPRFKSTPIATSTPFSDKQNSKSESNLVYPERRRRSRYDYIGDYSNRREYIRGLSRPADIFLRPLPGESLYRRGMVRRYEYEPCRVYGSYESLTKPSHRNCIYSKSSYDDDDRDEFQSIPSDGPASILKKSDSESLDKQSTSSADSVKDIKIYQNGGILIMQNFKDGFDQIERKEMSEFSAKLIENCNKLKEEIDTAFPVIQDKSLANSSEESKGSNGKMVQFDLMGSDYNGTKSESFSNVASKSDPLSRLDLPDSTSPESLKSKDNQKGPGLNQDFPSMSTQENDSIISNPLGMSPGASSKKLEWDSGADVGYLNLDLSKENLSTIERIVLKGLSSDGVSEKNVVFEKRSDEPDVDCEKIVLERKPSDAVVDEIAQAGRQFEADQTKVDNSGTDESTGRQGSRINPHHSNKKNKSSRIDDDDNNNNEDEDVDDDNNNNVTSGGSSGNNNNKDRDKKPVRRVRRGKKEIVEGFSVTKEKGVKEAPSSVDVTPDAQKTESPVIVELSDKSVNVNTLFSDKICLVPSEETVVQTRERTWDSSPKYRSSRVSPKPPRRSKSKLTSQRTNYTAPLKDKIESIIDLAKQSSRVECTTFASSSKMGNNSKKTYRRVEARPEPREFEKSREMDEIIIDQRLKIKNCPGSLREVTRGCHVDDLEGSEDLPKPKTSKRPISASSSSNNTVLPNDKLRGSDERTRKDQIELIDQIIQTNECQVESIGVQAFSTQKSSSDDTSASSYRKIGDSKPVKEPVNVCSKNIQAFGLNSSLPKQLAHPRESVTQETQNEKSTQYFGGPINSLPNYHSHVALKPAETCGRMMKVLKPKKNVPVDNLSEENRRNARCGSLDPGLEDPDTFENKENLISDPVTGSKRQETSGKRSSSQMSSMRNQLGSQSSDTGKGGRKSKRESRTGSDTTEKISCQTLTSEVLREHGDSIDRNLIQEKYFQSQLLEIEQKEMVCKSTSMDTPPGYFVPYDRDLTTVGCQYSLGSRDDVCSDTSKVQELSGVTDKANNGSKQETSYQYESSQNMANEGNFDASKCTNFEGGDSLQSDTQTAHSWVPGTGSGCHNKDEGVGVKAKSFEYLPGHVYEGEGNREEMSSHDAEPNMDVGTGTLSDRSSRAAKGNGATRLTDRSVDVGDAESEGRDTLVLENSNDASYESDQLKALDANLSQLNIVVTRLRKKDDEIQKVTQSLLINFRKQSGAGDDVDELVLNKSPAVDAVDGKGQIGGTIVLNGKTKRDANDERESDLSKADKPVRENDVSIACQTEGKSCDSSRDKSYDERKLLESKMATDKESQIKWIEKEIYHLNILRGLLEKQSSGSQKKKRSHHTVPSHTNSTKSDKSYSNVEDMCLPKPVTPVYGCTISLADTDNNPGQNDRSRSSETLTPERESPRSNGQVPNSSGNVKYGMAVSLNGNLRKVILLPAGVNVSVSNPKAATECEVSDVPNREHFRSGSAKYSEVDSSERQPRPCLQRDRLQSDMTTQCPSAKRLSENYPSGSGHTSHSSPRKCNYCQQASCVCLNLSRSSKSDGSANHPANGAKGRNASRSKPARSKFSCDSDSTSADIANMDESLKINSSKVSGGKSFDSTLSTSKDKKLSRCKCENCPDRTSNGEKSGFTCGNSCQSNIYFPCEKSCDERVGTSCGCSKVHVQKAQGCSCHIIKILGPKCCLPDSGSCCGKKRVSSRKMENQSCQTDCIAEKEEDSARSTRSLTQNPMAVALPAEDKVAPAVRNPVEETRPCSSRLPNEPLTGPDPGIDAQEKSDVRRDPVSMCDVSVGSATMTTDCICNCTKAGKEKKGTAKTDDHPRHYFLKIEETEVDEVNESMERRRSLEVITVTVPVKKAGKGKIYGKVISQTISTASASQATTPPKCRQPCRCKCCDDDGQVEPTSKKPGRNAYDDLYSLYKAEKPDSSKRRASPYFESTGEYDSYVDVEPCKETMAGNDGYHPTRATRPSQNHHRDTSDRPRPGPAYDPRSSTSDYDSHKEFRPNLEKVKYPDFEGNNKSEFSSGGERRCYANERFDVGPTATRNAGSNRRYKDTPDRNEYEYYNYNKREYMTKSELLREEEKKRKKDDRRGHHPSLQEYLESNRPDFCSSAESRRRIISERAKERVKKHTNRVECLMNLIHQCGKMDTAKGNAGPKRIFTTPQMREQTMKRYRQLPEVTEKIENEKKKEEYRTNKLMGDIFAKKLQLEALKGHINLSNSVSVLSTI